MTTAANRRVNKVQGALHPCEAVLAWLAEAQQYPSLVDHVRSVTELPVEAAPLSVIGDRVEAAVRLEMRGHRHDEVEAAVRRAVRDGVFLFTLVIVINAEALEMARVEGLRAAATFYWMSCLLGGPRADDLPAEEAEGYRRELAGCWVQWRAVVDRLDVEMRVENDARGSLERQFLGGRKVLFADAESSWASHVDMVQRLLRLADAIESARAATSRSQRSDTAGTTPVEALVADRVTRLADDARVRAYETLGDRPQAVRILERRLASI